MSASLSSRNAWRVRLGLAGLVVAVYAVALTSPFQFDDRGVIGRGAQGLRPLLGLGYALSAAVGGGATWPFHVMNLLIHLAATELVMRLFSAATQPDQRWPFQALYPGGVLAGTLFALHPIQTEAVTYITGRSASQATALLLLGLLAYVGGARASRWWLSWLLAPLCFAAAVASKETSAGFPLLLLAWEVLVERSRASVVARRVGPWLALGLFGFLAMVMHPRTFTLLDETLGPRPFVDVVRYQLGGVGYLLSRLALWGLPCVDPGLWLAPPASGVVYGVASLLVAALGAAFWRGTALLRFGLALFVLQVLVLHVLVPRVDLINERHAYLGNAGLFLALGALLADVARRRLALASLVVALLAALTLRRNLEYRTEVALWRATVREAPHNPRAHNNLGVACELAGEPALARLAYAEALRLEPRYQAARENYERRQNVGRQ
jgi:protein O-mannosyl-transferase